MPSGSSCSLCEDFWFARERCEGFEVAACCSASALGFAVVVASSDAPLSCAPAPGAPSGAGFSSARASPCATERREATRQIQTVGGGKDGDEEER